MVKKTVSKLFPKFKQGQSVTFVGQKPMINNYLIPIRHLYIEVTPTSLLISLNTQFETVE